MYEQTCMCVLGNLFLVSCFHAFLGELFSLVRDTSFSWCISRNQFHLQFDSIAIRYTTAKLHHGNFLKAQLHANSSKRWREHEDPTCPGTSLQPDGTVFGSNEVFHVPVVFEEIVLLLAKKGLNISIIKLYAT